MKKSKLKKKASLKVMQFNRRSSGRHSWPQIKRWRHILAEVLVRINQTADSNEFKLSYREMFEALGATSTHKGIGPRGLHKLEMLLQKGRYESLIGMFQHIKVNARTDLRGGYRVAVTNAYHHMMNKRNEDSGVSSHQVISKGNSLGDNSVLQSLKQSMSK
jgi:hypothetical protein